MHHYYTEAESYLARTLPGGGSDSTPFEEGAAAPEDNSYSSQELKRDTRRLNSVIGQRKYKRPNAQKYGVYATPVIIPGEDRSEFQALLAELLAWWQPAGPDLRHAVHCLADTMWRLRRLKKGSSNRAPPKHLRSAEPRL